MITSLTNEKVKHYTKLNQKKYRDKSGEFLITDQSLLKYAKENNLLKVLITSLVDTEEKGVLSVTKEIALKISNGLTDSEIGVMNKLDYSFKDEYKKLIILDNLQDPLNLGMILNLVDVLKYDAVIASLTTTDLYNEKVMKKAKSSFLNVPFIKCDLVPFINNIKEKGYSVYSTGLRNESKELKEVTVYEKLALVMGNEGSGVTDEVFNLSDEIIKIDMYNIDSLNVATASAISMFNM